MSVCDLRRLNTLTLDSARNSIRQYCLLPGPWLHQYDRYFETTRTAQPEIRLLELLETVRGSGWGMNRKGQCAHISDEIKSGRISKEKIESFWDKVDLLNKVKLRDLPNANQQQLRLIEVTFDDIRTTLRKWHSSADSLCFLTKVVLMFNWGESPAFDTRIRDVLKVRNNISSKDLVTALREIGVWIQKFESKYGIQLDELATNEMNSLDQFMELKPLPLGRSFDMMLFSL